MPVHIVANASSRKARFDLAGQADRQRGAKKRPCLLRCAACVEAGEVRQQHDILSASADHGCKLLLVSHDATLRGRTADSRRGLETMAVKVTSALLRANARP